MKFGLESTKHSRTPMKTTTKLSKDVSGKDVEKKLYKSMIGSLLHLIVSLLNISFRVGAYARYQANPKESHLTFVKRIIRYSDYVLWCPYDSCLLIVGYSDVDWSENVEDRKSTSNACLLLVIVLYLSLV